MYTYNNMCYFYHIPQALHIPFLAAVFQSDVMRLVCDMCTCASLLQEAIRARLALQENAELRAAISEVRTLPALLCILTGYCASSVTSTTTTGSKPIN
jgi:hypothetical protein